MTTEPATQRLLENNRRWSAARIAEDPEFFERLVKLQEPDFFWIGCADSRVPANQIVGTEPGEIFVHRNVANIVQPGDANCLSALQFAVDVLKVSHVIVCGHYGCGGVAAALEDHPSGPLGHWLDNVYQVYQSNRAEVDALAGPARQRRMCELNVLEQAVRVAKTTTVREAWARGQPLTIHSWAYDLHDGLLSELCEPVSGATV